MHKPPKSAPVSTPWKNYLAGLPGLGARPLVVGVLTSFGGATAALKLKARPCDLVEWRLDLTGQKNGLWLERCFALEQAGLPVLLTIRSSAEGGRWFGEEPERLTLYRRGLDVVHAVDVEINNRLLPQVIAAAHALQKPVVGSFHDFTETPPRAVLEEVIRLGWKSGADIVKLAVKLRSPDDLALLLALLQTATPQRPLCVIGMGDPQARLDLARAGSCLAYGYLDRPTATGQLACAELAAQLRCGA